MKYPILLPLALLACSHAVRAQEAAPVDFEKSVIVPAADLLGPAALRGTTYRVRDAAATDGYRAYFKVDTDFGTFDAIGVPQARQRIAEVEAIRKLVETSKSDLFAEGLKRSVEQPIAAVKNIVTNPVDTVKQAPKTVGHFFGKVGSAVGRGVENVAERASGNGPSSSAGETASAIGHAARSAAGFDKAKLDTAKQLGVDPYSDNSRLQEEMDKVTWAFFAGGLPLRIGAAAASAGLALTATTMAGIPEDVYALTPSELALRDSKSLAAMGVSEEATKAFQIHRALSVTRRHRIVTLLDCFPKAQGRAAIVALANSCTDADQADFLIGALAILAERQHSGAADFASLQVLGRLPVATTTGGEMNVPAPVDHVTWTEEVAGFAQRDDLGTAPKVLVHTGSLSPAATGHLQAGGWKLEAVRYPAR